LLYLFGEKQLAEFFYSCNQNFHLFFISPAQHPHSASELCEVSWSEWFEIFLCIDKEVVI